MSCGVGRRCSLDMAWLRLLPMAIAPIRPLAWELPYAVGAALNRTGKQTNKQKPSYKADRSRGDYF